VTLAQRAAEGADAPQIADAIVQTWKQIDAALAPIIGKGSVAVLYLRSVHLIEPAHPWLAHMQTGVPSVVDLAALKAILSRQDSETAAAAGGALLQTFYELLASLVGPSLTERLLRTVWENPLSGTPAQDTSP
jgi:hypothetical protein